jgi:hypothetical protein
MRVPIFPIFTFVLLQVSLWASAGLARDSSMLGIKPFSTCTFALFSAACQCITQVLHPPLLRAIFPTVSEF